VKEKGRTSIKTHSFQVVSILFPLPSVNQPTSPATAAPGPLHRSCEQGQLQVVNYLTEVMANPQKADLNGTRPLHLAALHGQLEVVRVLVAAGAQKDTADQHGALPLHMAALNGETEP